MYEYIETIIQSINLYSTTIKIIPIQSFTYGYGNVVNIDICTWLIVTTCTQETFVKLHIIMWSDNIYDLVFETAISIATYINITRG